MIKVNKLLYETIKSIQKQQTLKFHELINKTSTQIYKMLKTATKIDAGYMAKFMVQMALETQNKKLDIKLVQKAVEYFIESDFGQPLVKKIDDIPVAALFLNYQNQQAWWISSVFVAKPYRGLGIFSELFHFAEELARKNNVKYIRLYAQKSNSKAKKTYEHIGMHCTDEQFYGYDLTCQNILFLDNPLLKVKKVDQVPKLQGMIDLCHKDLGKNKGLGCYLDNNLEGYCQYFLQFSEWRFGLTVYISSLFIQKGQIAKEVLTQFIQYLRRYQQLNVTTIRIIMKNANKQLIHLAPRIRPLKYDIFEIDLQEKRNVYAKL